MLRGNTTTFRGEKLAMPTSKYKHDDRDLTQEEVEKGVLSMEGLLNKLQVWAATDLNLVLESPNEEKII